MFSFTKNQEIWEIATVKIGGQPGMYPTVLFGGLFFKGKPDFIKAQESIEMMIQTGKKTGNPGIPDFFIRKEEYIEEILEFIEQHVPQNLPFSVDITDPVVKVQVLKMLDERQLLSRTIYNSLHVGLTDEEVNALAQYTPEMIIVVAFNPKDTSPDGKIEVLENGAHLTKQGLLTTVEKIGVKKILIDTAALAPGENSGAAIAAIPVIKEEYGLPTGCAIHNVVEKSFWLQEFLDARETVDAGSNINIPVFGGDFTLFGPIERASLAFPVVAWQDILVSEYTERYFGVTPCDSHPRRKLLG